MRSLYSNALCKKPHENSLLGKKNPDNYQFSCKNDLKFGNTSIFHFLYVKKICLNTLWLLHCHSYSVTKGLNDQKITQDIDILLYGIEMSLFVENNFVTHFATFLLVYQTSILVYS